MRQLILLSLVLIFLFSCNSRSDKNSIDPHQFNAEIALKFVNSYKIICDSLRESKNIDNWIKDNPILTNSFKFSYRKTLDDAFKDEPELGLDFDPIFDAQYYPDKGFEILECDSANGYVVLRGKEIYNKFTVTVKIIHKKDKWFVDGSGIINIPNDKRRIND